MGDKQNQPFQLSFNASVKIDFQGSRVTSDGGLVLVRELDERLGFGELIEQHLVDHRQGKNTQFALADLLRQSVYSRLAGYEDVNDAERLAQDPTFRLIGSEKNWERGAALTSRLQSFETQMLAENTNFAGLSAVNRELIAKVEAVDSPKRVVLDMDSTEIPVYGQQENSAYNGHFESTCYHPLLLFNREGDCLAAKLRPGNVHSADGWEEMLLPEIDRQQKLGKEVTFRADAAFAKPEVYEKSEERGVKYAIRMPANDSLERDIAELLTRPVGRPSHKPVVRYKSFLYQAASWNKARRVVAKVEFHAGELFPRVGFIVTNLEADSRAVVRFYNRRGTAEQWIREGKQAVKMTRLSCHRFRSNEVRLWLSVIAYNLGNLWRRLVLPERIENWSLTSLQQRLVKTGGRLIKHARYYWLSQWACGPPSVMKTRAAGAWARECLVHPMSVSVRPVEIAAAVENWRPFGCLIRDLHLSQEVCAPAPGGGLGRGSTRPCLRFPFASPAGCADGRSTMGTSYRVAGIDVHKSMLAVVVSDATREGEFHFERRKFGAAPSELCALRHWLSEQGVREAVMESTAQYWKPVWQELEGHCALYLAQAHSNRAPRGRKRDFADAERLLRRHVAGELILSFVPEAEQRLWRTMTRSKHQLTRDRVRIYSQIEALLEDGRIKLGAWVSDLLGVGSRRMLRALAAGETDPAKLAAMREVGMRATVEQLQDALSEAARWSSLHREILGLFLTRLDLIETQIERLDLRTAEALREHHAAVQRLAEVPGFGIDSAQQVIAEVGPKAASFPSPQQLASWVGTCPGREESAEVSKNNRSPKGNRMMRRVLNQTANAAVKSKGSVFQNLYRRLVPRLGHNKAIWAVAHRLCRLIWKILHQGVRYIEFGIRTNPKAVQKRAKKLLRELRALGYQVQVQPSKLGPPATPEAIS